MTPFPLIQLTPRQGGQADGAAPAPRAAPSPEEAEVFAALVIGLEDADTGADDPNTAETATPPPKGPGADTGEEEATEAVAISPAATPLAPEVENLGFIGAAHGQDVRAEPGEATLQSGGQMPGTPAATGPMSDGVEGTADRRNNAPASIGELAQQMLRNTSTPVSAPVSAPIVAPSMAANSMGFTAQAAAEVGGNILANEVAKAVPTSATAEVSTLAASVGTTTTRGTIGQGQILPPTGTPPEPELAQQQLSRSSEKTLSASTNMSSGGQAVSPMAPPVVSGSVPTSPGAPAITLPAPTVQQAVAAPGGRLVPNQGAQAVVRAQNTTPASMRDETSLGDERPALSAELAGSRPTAVSTASTQVPVINGAAAPGAQGPITERFGLHAAQPEIPAIDAASTATRSEVQTSDIMPQQTAGPAPAPSPLVRSPIETLLPNARTAIANLADRAIQDMETTRATNGTWTTEMELAPADLGRLRMSLQTGERGLHVVVLVEREQSVAVVRQQLEALHRGLVADGLAVERVEIATTSLGSTSTSSGGQGSGLAGFGTGSPGAETGTQQRPEHSERAQREGNGERDGQDADAAAQHTPTPDRPRGSGLDIRI